MYRSHSAPRNETTISASQLEAHLQTTPINDFSEYHDMAERLSYLDNRAHNNVPNDTSSKFYVDTSWIYIRFISLLGLAVLCSLMLIVAFDSVPVRDYLCQVTYQWMLRITNVRLRSRISDELSPEARGSIYNNVEDGLNRALASFSVYRILQINP